MFCYHDYAINCKTVTVVLVYNENSNIVNNSLGVYSCSIILSLINMLFLNV